MKLYVSDWRNILVSSISIEAVGEYTGLSLMEVNCIEDFKRVELMVCPAEVIDQISYINHDAILMGILRNEATTFFESQKQS